MITNGGETTVIAGDKATMITYSFGYDSDHEPGTDQIVLPANVLMMEISGQLNGSELSRELVQTIQVGFINSKFWHDLGYTVELDTDLKFKMKCDMLSAEAKALFINADETRSPQARNAQLARITITAKVYTRDTANDAAHVIKCLNYCIAGVILQLEPLFPLCVSVLGRKVSLIYSLHN